MRLYLSNCARDSSHSVSQSVRSGQFLEIKSNQPTEELIAPFDIASIINSSDSCTSNGREFQARDYWCTMIFFDLAHTLTNILGHCGVEQLDSRQSYQKGGSGSTPSDVYFKHHGTSASSKSHCRSAHWQVVPTDSLPGVSTQPVSGWITA